MNGSKRRQCIVLHVRFLRKNVKKNFDTAKQTTEQLCAFSNNEEEKI